MAFEKMDGAAYRAMSNEAFELRCKEVHDELLNADSEVSYEDLKAEYAIIEQERGRRALADSFKIEERKAVAAGVGEVVASTEPKAEPKTAVKRDMSLGGRVWDAIQERGITRDQSFQVSNIAFRAAGDPHADDQLGDASTLGYYADELTQTDTRIREGYRRPLTIWDLFNHELTEKDSVAYYEEGAMEGGAGMTAELGAFSQLHVAKPTRKTATLKKVTAIWKQSDEILTDAPRFVTHVNSRAAYNLDITVEDQLVKGDGTGENLTGITNASGILVPETMPTAYDLSFIENLLIQKTRIRKATPNFTADALLVADEDYDTLQVLKNESDQYVLGGPVGVIYGSNVTVGDILWRTIRIVPTPALESGTSILGAFKAGATVYEHVTGRRFDTGYDGDDFSHGRVSFRAYQRLALAVEYPGAFCKYTIG